MEGYQMLKFIFDFTMLLILIAIAVIDIKIRLINQKLLIMLLVLSIAAIFFRYESRIIESIYATGIVFSVLSLIYFLSRKSIGWGDVKLCSCVAFYFGLERGFSVLFLSIILCGLWAFLMFMIKRTQKQSEIPFAPFVSLGSLMAIIVKL